MAVPAERPSFFRSPLNLGLIALCGMLTFATVQRQEHVLIAAATALDGLAISEVVALEALDQADLPAMDPRLAQVVDPRPAFAFLLNARPRRTGVQPFQYDVQPGETVGDVAARFGVTVSALLWNNGLEHPDQVQPGDQLTVLPVSGVLHRAEPGETLSGIARRFSVAIGDLMRANAIEDPDVLLAGQVLVIPGWDAPMPAAVTDKADAAVSLTAAEAEPARADAAPIAAPAPEPAVVAVLHEANLPAPPNATRSQRDFILSIAPGARESHVRTGVPASVTLAQAILESDWGRSRLTREAKNLFGIKAHSRPGTAGVYHISTWEVEGGQDVMRVEPFKAYVTMAESIVDHGRWFHQQPRYARALAVRDDPRAFARAINDAGYATDPAYSAKLITLMDRFDLYAYDVN
jgi:flagellum-specific peptidoglycan hydrolase FlgJ